MNSFKFGHISNPWTKSYYFMTEKALRKIICSRSWGTLCEGGQVGTTKTSAFLTNAQSRFVIIILDDVL